MNKFALNVWILWMTLGNVEGSSVLKFENQDCSLEFLDVLTGADIAKVKTIHTTLPTEYRSACINSPEASKVAEPLPVSKQVRATMADGRLTVDCPEAKAQFSFKHSMKNSPFRMGWGRQKLAGWTTVPPVNLQPDEKVVDTYHYNLLILCDKVNARRQLLKNLINPIRGFSFNDPLLTSAADQFSHRTPTSLWMGDKFVVVDMPEYGLLAKLDTPVYTGYSVQLKSPFLTRQFFGLPNLSGFAEKSVANQIASNPFLADSDPTEEDNTVNSSLFGTSYGADPEISVINSVDEKIIGCAYKNGRVFAIVKNPSQTNYPLVCENLKHKWNIIHGIANAQEFDITPAEEESDLEVSGGYFGDFTIDAENRSVLGHALVPYYVIPIAASLVNTKLQVTVDPKISPAKSLQPHVAANSLQPHVVANSLQSHDIVDTKNSATHSLEPHVTLSPHVTLGLLADFGIPVKEGYSIALQSGSSCVMQFFGLPETVEIGERNLANRIAADATLRECPQVSWLANTAKDLFDRLGPGLNAYPNVFVQDNATGCSDDNNGIFAVIANSATQTENNALCVELEIMWLKIKHHAEAQIEDVKEASCLMTISSASLGSENAFTVPYHVIKDAADVKFVQEYESNSNLIVSVAGSSKVRFSRSGPSLVLPSAMFADIIRTNNWEEFEKFYVNIFKAGILVDDTDEADAASSRPMELFTVRLTLAAKTFFATQHETHKLAEGFPVEIPDKAPPEYKGTKIVSEKIPAGSKTYLSCTREEQTIHRFRKTMQAEGQKEWECQKMFEYYDQLVKH